MSFHMCEPSKIFECQAPYPKIREESFPNMKFFNQIELESPDIMPVPGNLLHKYRIFLCLSHLQLLTLHRPQIKIGAHLNIFCMQMPPINFDFEKLILVGLGTQEFFQKVYRDG